MADVLNGDGAGDESQAYDALAEVVEMIQEKNYVSLSQFFDHLFTVFAKHDKPIQPTEVENSYTGIHLGSEYEENDFVKMANGFYNNQSLHAKYAVQILRDSVNLLKKMENIRRCDLNQSKTDLPGVVIVGDLHGHYTDLFYIMKKFGIPGKKYRFVFNGDIVDRGSQQSECLLTILYAFLMYPSRVFINRGNHEDKSLNLNKQFAPNFKNDTDSKFGKYASAVFQESQHVFRYLPLATVVKNKAGYKCFVTHGGISSRLDLDFVANALPRSQFEIISPSNKHDPQTRYAAEQLSDLLWSDPLVKKEGRLNAKVPSELGCYPNSHRGLGWLFGPDVTDRFCARYGFTSVIRSHEVRDEGISHDHPRLFTIFSSSNYSTKTNKAAVIFLPAEEETFTVEKFSTQRLDESEEQNERNGIISTFKQFLANEKDILLRRFKREDRENTGLVNLDKWASIITSLVRDKINVNLDPQHVVTLRDFLCPCEDTQDAAKYTEMFSGEQTANQGIMDLLDQIFALIDTNQNGTLSTQEAHTAVNEINRIVGTRYSHRFISNMDTNKDGVVDINEFRAAFMSTMRS